MKKCEIPKPKFDIGDFVAFKYTEMIERADDVPEVKEIRTAGEIAGIAITKHGQVWVVAYEVSKRIVEEDQLKLVRV